MMLSKGASEEIVNKFRVGLKKLQQSGKLETIATKWKKILGIDLRYTPEKGFYVKQ